jgi:hypothetical protein
MTKHLDTCLHLVLPGALKDRILDQLLMHAHWVGPFTTHRVEGHGDPESIASPAEQVRGRAERVQIEILMESAHVGELLNSLRADIPSPQVTWWQTAISASGSFA